MQRRTTKLTPVVDCIKDFNFMIFGQYEHCSQLGVMVHNIQRSNMQNYVMY